MLSVDTIVENVQREYPHKEESSPNSKVDDRGGFDRPDSGLPPGTTRAAKKRSRNSENSPGEVKLDGSHPPSTYGDGLASWFHRVPISTFSDRL